VAVVIFEFVSTLFRSSGFPYNLPIISACFICPNHVLYHKS